MITIGEIHNLECLGAFAIMGVYELVQKRRAIKHIKHNAEVLLNGHKQNGNSHPPTKYP